MIQYIHLAVSVLTLLVASAYLILLVKKVKPPKMMAALEQINPVSHDLALESIVSKTIALLEASNLKGVAKMRHAVAHAGSEAKRLNMAPVPPKEWVSRIERQLQKVKS